jgi:hypothetical protein
MEHSQAQILRRERRRPTTLDHDRAPEVEAA